MECRILDLGNQYKIAVVHGMRYSIIFPNFTQPVLDFESKLRQRFGRCYSTTIIKANIDYPYCRWYSGWKSLRSARSTDWMMTFRDEKDRTLALLLINQ